MGFARLRPLTPDARKGWMTLLFKLVPSGVRPLNCTWRQCTQALAPCAISRLGLKLKLVGQRYRSHPMSQGQEQCIRVDHPYEVTCCSSAFAEAASRMPLPSVMLFMNLTMMPSSSNSVATCRIGPPTMS